MGLFVVDFLSSLCREKHFRLLLNLLSELQMYFIMPRTMEIYLFSAFVDV